MKIEWNKVTWYSWVAAVIVFGGAFATGMYVGMNIEDIKMDSRQSVSAIHETGTSERSDASTTVTYACDGGKQIQAMYSDKSVHVRTNDGKDLVLPQTLSADGGRYANSNESFIFWSKGDGASVMQTMSGVSTTTYANCIQIAAPIQ